MKVIFPPLSFILHPKKRRAAGPGAGRACLLRGALLGVLGGSSGRVSESSEFTRFGAERPSDAFFGNSGFDHLGAEIVASAFGKNVTLHRACFVTHATREPAQPEAKTRPVEVVGHGTGEHAFELAHPRVLPALEPIIFPGRVPWTEQARGLHGESLVHEVLAERGDAPCFPIGVEATGRGDRAAKFGAALR